MADFLGGLLSGGGNSLADLYGDLLTPQQLAALQREQSTQGLLRMAGAFADAGMPSRMPIPLGSAIGKAAAAFGGGQEEALKGIQTAAQIRELQAKAKIREQMFGPEANARMQALFERLGPGGVPPPPTAARLPPVALGAPTGGPLSSNAPPPPPTVPPPGSGYVGPSNEELGAPPIVPNPPGKLTGLLSPPDQVVGQPPPGQGLLAQIAAMQQGGGIGGGTASGTLPFSLASAAPPGAGAVGDDRRIQIEPLSGAAMPAGVDLPFPTVQNPNKPRSAWEQGVRYDRSNVPFDPANPRATPEQYRAPGGGFEEVAGGGGAASKAAASNLTGSAWEIANNNFGGMRRPGVNATPSQGGFQTFNSPEAGIAAISNQLDRYASGATTGKPLSTIREIVSTWAPPSENDTETLIKRATQVMGVADNIPLNIADPAVKAKLIEATIRNEQGGKLPVDPSVIAQMANAKPQDQVIPSGRGVSASVLRRIADTGGGVAPVVPGVDPRAMNALLLELAQRNAAAEALGMGNPYGSMLSVLQGSPGYKGQIAGEEAKATQPYTQQNQANQTYLNIRQDMAKDNMTFDDTGKIVPLPEAQRIRQMNADQLAEAKAKWEAPQDVPVYGPDGTIKVEKMTPFESRRREADKSSRVALGDTMPRPGDIAQTPYMRPGQAEQETAANAPQHLGPTDTVVYPPGSVGASKYQSDKMRGTTLPDNVAIQPDGSVRVSGGGVTTGQIDQTQKDFMALKDEAAAARSAIYKTNLLRDQLHQIGTSGPATATLGALGSWAQQLGVPESTVKEYTGARPASVEVAEKLSQDLLGEVLKTTFPQRITNADISAWKNTVPRGTMLQDAYDLLIDKVLAPKFEQTVARYGAVAALPGSDPQLRTYTQKLDEFDKANPMEKFVGTYIYGQGALAGHRLRLIDNQWVDTTTGKVVK